MLFCVLLSISVFYTSTWLLTVTIFACVTKKKKVVSPEERPGEELWRPAKTSPRVTSVKGRGRVSGQIDAVQTLPIDHRSRVQQTRMETEQRQTRTKQSPWHNRQRVKSRVTQRLSDPKQSSATVSNSNDKTDETSGDGDIDDDDQYQDLNVMASQKPKTNKTTATLQSETVNETEERSHKIRSMPNNTPKLAAQAPARPIFISNYGAVMNPKQGTPGLISDYRPPPPAGGQNNKMISLFYPAAAPPVQNKDHKFDTYNAEGVLDSAPGADDVSVKMDMKTQGTIPGIPQQQPTNQHQAKDTGTGGFIGGVYQPRATARTPPKYCNQ